MTTTRAEHVNISTPERVGILPLWSLHLLAFLLPVTSLVFLITGPHDLAWALLFFSIVPLSVMVDNRAGPSRAQPEETLAAWPFDLMVLLLTFIQFANILLLARVASEAGLQDPATWVTAFTVGINTGYSAIVVAHELVHRSNPVMFTLGRLMMGTALYEHFSTEHVRGHHARVGTPEDAATARFGETWREFWKRTVRQQFVSAWRIEQKRLGDEGMRAWDARNLRNRVLHGVVGEVVLVALLGAAFGWEASVMMVFQAYWAVSLLEVVNYFEHWGLTRTSKKVQVVDSWDTESWFSRFTLVGLSRHADHHAHAARPYQQLRHFEESPKMPRGYFGMAMVAIFQNERFRREMTERLVRYRGDVTAHHQD